jgi:hypothetical protein
MRRLLASKKAVTTSQIGLIAVVAIVAVAAGVYYAMLPPAEAPVEQIRIKWGMHWTDKFMQDWWVAQFDKYENAFNLANPDKNLTIEIVAAGGGELMTLLTTSFQAGESIDMFHIGISNAYVLQEAGAIELGFGYRRRYHRRRDSRVPNGVLASCDRDERVLLRPSRRRDAASGRVRHATRMG